MLPAMRVISVRSGLNTTTVGYPVTRNTSPHFCASGRSPSRYTATNSLDFSMKSGRLNTADLSCLQGGHHCAPQYSSTGLLDACAALNAASTSPSNHAMPGASECMRARSGCAGFCAGACADASRENAVKIAIARSVERRIRNVPGGSCARREWVATLACAAMKRPSFDAILAARLSRRTLIASAAASAGLAACARIPTRQAPSSSSTHAMSTKLKGIAPQSDDAFVVDEAYRYNIVARWGDSIVTGTPDFDTRRMADSSWLTAEAVDAQSRQFGTNCDAVQYFPLGHVPSSRGRAAHGLVCVNHKYFSGEL